MCVCVLYACRLPTRVIFYRKGPTTSSFFLSATRLDLQVVPARLRAPVYSRHEFIPSMKIKRQWAGFPFLSVLYARVVVDREEGRKNAKFQSRMIVRAASPRTHIYTFLGEEGEISPRTRFYSVHFWIFFSLLLHSESWGYMELLRLRGRAEVKTRSVILYILTC